MKMFEILVHSFNLELNAIYQNFTVKFVYINNIFSEKINGIIGDAF